jgi:hypothetical protein
MIFARLTMTTGDPCCWQVRITREQAERGAKQCQATAHSLVAQLWTSLHVYTGYVSQP